MDEVIKKKIDNVLQQLDVLLKEYPMTHFVLAVGMTSDLPSKKGRKTGYHNLFYDVLGDDTIFLNQLLALLQWKVEHRNEELKR